jgi:DNA-binding transcriptional ArsR family regulator
MINSHDLRLFGLTGNAAKVVSYLVDLMDEPPLTYKDIKRGTYPSRFFYRESLEELISKGFVSVVNDTRPKRFKLNPERFKEVVQEEKTQHRQAQQVLKDMLRDAKNNGINTALNKVRVLLDLDTLQLEMMQELSSKKEMVSLKELTQHSQKKVPALRYALNLLEGKGYVRSKKVGREKYYEMREVSNILEEVMAFKERSWNAKKKRMDGVLVSIDQGRTQAHIEVKSSISHLDDYREIVKIHWEGGQDALSQSRRHAEVKGARMVFGTYLCLLECAERQILNVSAPARVDLKVAEMLVREEFLSKQLEILEARCKARVRIKCVRNDCEPPRSFFDGSSIREYLKRILLMHPMLQMRHVLPERINDLDFLIVDGKVLFAVDANKGMRGILTTEPLLIQEFAGLFESMWSQSKDVLVSWYPEFGVVQREKIVDVVSGTKKVIRKGKKVKKSRRRA